MGWEDVVVMGVAPGKEKSSGRVRAGSRSGGGWGELVRKGLLTLGEGSGSSSKLDPPTKVLANGLEELLYIFENISDDLSAEEVRSVGEGSADLTDRDTGEI